MLFSSNYRSLCEEHSSSTWVRHWWTQSGLPLWPKLRGPRKGHWSVLIKQQLLPGLRGPRKGHWSVLIKQQLLPGLRGPRKGHWSVLIKQQLLPGLRGPRKGHWSVLLEHQPGPLYSPHMLSLGAFSEAAGPVLRECCPRIVEEARTARMCLVRCQYKHQYSWEVPVEICPSVCDQQDHCCCDLNKTASPALKRFSFRGTMGFWRMDLGTVALLMAMLSMFRDQSLSWTR